MSVHTGVHRSDLIDEPDQQIIQQGHHQDNRVYQYKLQQEIIPQADF